LAGYKKVLIWEEKMKYKWLNFVLTLTVILVMAGNVGCGVLPLLRKPAPTATLLSEPTPTLGPVSKVTPAPVPTSSVNGPAAASMENECRAAIDGIYELRKDLGLPKHFMNGEATTAQEGDFDPNSYFDVLTHLKMEPGYVLDYIYFGDSVGGKPLIYARKADAAPFKTYDELLESFGEKVTDERSYKLLNHAFDFLYKVQIDNTPESYLEYVFLAFLGDQFYLNWHAAYSDQIVLCSADSMKYVDQEMEGFGQEFPEEVAAGISIIDFTPRLLDDGNIITIRFVTFSKWGGFYENVYKIDKEKGPVDPVDVQWNHLIEYDCGIKF